MPLSRRDFLTRFASIGATLAGLAAAPGPMMELLGETAGAAAGGLSPANLRTFIAVCEAVCSFDGRNPPPARLSGRSQPTAGDLGDRFAAEYRAQSAAIQQTLALLLALVEQAPRTGPPLGAVSVQDLAAFGGHAFSQLGVPLRLRFIRSWASDFDPGPAGLEGFDTVGALHRGIAAALIQLSSLFYYQDPRSWSALGYGGPWLHREHENEEMPFSHLGHDVVRIYYGDGVVA
jgi:hypothetical protein